VYLAQRWQSNVYHKGRLIVFFEEEENANSGEA
jgi:hypothetical protein